MLKSDADAKGAKMVLVKTTNKMPVSLLQELAAINKLIPEYKLVHNEPVGQNPIFSYSVELVKLVVNSLKCNSKKKAKHLAALEMLLMLNKLPESSEFENFINEFPQDLVDLARHVSSLDLSEVQRLHGSSGKF